MWGHTARKRKQTKYYIGYIVPKNCVRPKPILTI